MIETWYWVVGGLGVAWVLQFVMSFFQMQRYYKRLAQLRRSAGRDCLCATGMAGNRLRTRAYGVLVVDRHNRVRAAETLTGFTVFAGLKPAPAMLGLSLDSIHATLPPPKGVGRKSWEAFGAAADYLRKHIESQSEESEEQESSLAPVATHAEVLLTTP